MTTGHISEPGAYKVYASSPGAWTGAGRWIPAGDNGSLERLAAVPGQVRAQCDRQPRERAVAGNERLVPSIRIQKITYTTGVDRERDGSHNRETRRVKASRSRGCTEDVSQRTVSWGKRFGRVWAWLPLSCFNPGCRPFWFQLGVPLGWLLLPSSCRCPHATFNRDRAADPDATAIG